MIFTQLKLLIWKNYRLRRYHWFMTLIEFALPILFAYVIVKIPSWLNLTRSVTKMNATVHNSISKSQFLSVIRHATLYYAPKGPATDSFMARISNTDGIIRYPGEGRSSHGFVDETELISALRNASYHYQTIGIMFKNIVSNQSLPDKLSYVLRSAVKGWDTKNLYDVKLNPEKLNSSQTAFYANLFAPVQLLINENFIKLKTSYSLPSQPEFELFPFPEYTLDTSPRGYMVIGVGWVIILIVLIVSIPLINDMIEEKDSGMKELMKITGLDEWIMWFSWFLHALTVSFISLTIVTVILTQPLSEPGSEAIYFVQFSVLWLLLILYCVANISFCFMFSSIFHKTAVASTMFIITYIVLAFGIFWLAVNYAEDNLYLRLATLFPAGAFILGGNNILHFETSAIELTWSSVNTSPNNENGISLLFCFLMLTFDTFLYFFLAFYISSINPGKFGTRKSPLFMFQRLFSRFSNDTKLSQNLDDEVESKFFEPPPANVKPTIKIKNLHKTFGHVYAVRGVNLNIYPGEMTALLGHNGAGKTTTMSIMTGLTSPSAGSMYFKNRNIFKNMKSFRKRLGMCPQENRTMPYLTVVQHLLFFGQLKGSTRKEAAVEANDYLYMMEMQSKRNALAKQLSGGMKRKLCLSIALMGKAEILVLDEPTSGMDVQSRRNLWDLLLEMRGERTIIFTTHYMEEADALGDRIAIMNHGVIVCHGTPIFLKKAYGTGYELTITKSNDGFGDVDWVIKNVLPDATREFETSDEVVYKLPLTETNKFPILFKNLEFEAASLGIEHMSVAATTMEHVFLKAGGVSNMHRSKLNRNSNTDTDFTRDSGDLTYVEGIFLYLQQVVALLKKKYLYTSRNLFSIFIRIILPTLLGLFVLFLFNFLRNRNVSPEPSIDLSISTYRGSVVMLSSNLSNSDFEKHLSEYVTQEGGSFIKVVNTQIESELLKKAENILAYKKNYLSAFEFLNSIETKVLFNPPLIHSLPVTITTYSNVLLRLITNNTLYEIKTFHHPVPKEEDSIGACASQKASLTVLMCCLWFFALALFTVDLMSYFSAFVIAERIDGFQHIQIMSNVSPSVYWFGTLMFDVLFFLVVTGGRVGFYQLIEPSNFLGLNSSLGVFALVVTLYGISGLLFSYVLSYLSTSKGGSYLLLVIFNLICGIIVLIIYVVELFGAQRDFALLYKILYYVVRAVILIVPSLNFSLLFIKLMAIFYANDFCATCAEELKLICKDKAYLEFASEENPSGLLLEIIFLLIDMVLYTAILSFINVGYVRLFFNSLKNSIYGTYTTNRDGGDYDVQQEYSKVQQYKKYGTQDDDVALLADGLRKNYTSWFKSFTAVSNVSFIVEAGECFGLLGVNGAGKSTTFKMLTGEIMPTLGDSSIENVKLSTNRSEYLSMAGYCPQTDSFIEELTGREMLAIIAAMRGVSRKENQALVDEWINIIGLEEYQNRRCGTYSGGNKRKLCTAMSLIGDPSVVFLDEPTTGVDPVSRRSLYDVMAQSKEAGQAVILTSHSMEECETLCDRLTIMASGVMKCIGTTQHLKKLYGQGFSILIKINDVSDLDEEIDELHANMLDAFSEEYTVLKDEHRGLLYYQIKNTSLPWSVLFETMEILKNHHQELIDDYVLTDTTLEEVFISFAKGESTV